MAEVRSSTKCESRIIIVRPKSIGPKVLLYQDTKVSGDDSTLAAAPIPANLYTGALGVRFKRPAWAFPTYPR